MPAKREPRIGRTPDRNRVPVPERIVNGLVEARKAEQDAVKRRNKLIVQALDAGCSYRDVGAAAGLTQSRVHQIARSLGWPPPEMVAERERLLEESRRWRESMDRTYRELNEDE